MKNEEKRARGMDKEFALQLLFIGLLVGGAIFFARRLGSSTDTSTNLLPATEEEPRRYKNKEIRRIEYNEDCLPILIEITRDHTIA